MRTLGFVLAMVAGAVCWMPLLILRQGVYPFGAGFGHDDLVIFWTPIVLVATPLGVAACRRGAALGLAWTLALAPLLGYFNVAICLVKLIAASHAPSSIGKTPLSPNIGFWLSLLALAWGLRALERWATRRQPARVRSKADSRPTFRMMDGDD